MRGQAVCGVLLVVAGYGSSAAAPAAPDAGSRTVLNCRQIKNDSARLQCYDELPPDVARNGGASEALRAADDDKGVVAKWAGSSNMRTRPFHVDGPWELQWTTGKGLFAVTLHRLGGEGAESDLLTNGLAAASSRSFQPTGGDFYLEVDAMQAWTARVVALPGSIVPPASPPTQEPLLAVEGDQSGLPPCDGPGVDETLRSLIENSPMGKTMHISVLHVGPISSRPIRDGMAICKSTVLTNGGEMTYEFQFYRTDGGEFVFGKPTTP